MLFQTFILGRPSLSRCTYVLIVFVMGAVALPGCNETPPVEPGKPNASRSFVENPLGADPKAQQNLSPKVKADLDKAKKADPRGH
jgi:hypothetical protein